MKPLVLLVVAVGLASPARAQLPEASRVPMDAMTDLSFLVGRWQGDGWISRGPDQRYGFVQSERVTPLLGGDVLLIEGRGLASDDSSRVIHDAVAFIGYDAGEGRYTMRSFLPGGRGTDAQAHVADGAFVWSPASGDVRYTIRLTERGQWHEVGEVTRDGETWYPFLEMTLDRVAE